jgi:hypothetical protein
VTCFPQAKPRRDGSPRDTPSVVMCLLAIAAVMRVGANEGGEISPPHAPVESSRGSWPCRSVRRVRLKILAEALVINGPDTVNFHEG